MAMEYEQNILDSRLYYTVICASRRNKIPLAFQILGMGAMSSGAVCLASAKMYGWYWCIELHTCCRGECFRESLYKTCTRAQSRASVLL